MTPRITSLLMVLVLFGCTSTPDSGPETAEALPATPESTARADAAAIADFNRELTNAAMQSSVLTEDEYRLGRGDVVVLEAPQLEELNGTKVRIGGRGMVMLPLLGEVELGGKTMSEAERYLLERLREYVYTPQLSLFIEEYRSQEISVTGAVNNPGIFAIQRPRTLFELLSMAGGLNENAGFTINVRTRMPDPDTGQPSMQSLVIDLRKIVNDPRAQELVLGGGDMVYVPEAGVVFVEGAVEKPGSYPIRGDMNVLKSIAMAGGTKWEATEQDIRLIRYTDNGDRPEVIQVDLAAVRNNEASDISVRDGDIIAVAESGFRRGFASFWRGFTGIFNLGYGL